MTAIGPFRAYKPEEDHYRDHPVHGMRIKHGLLPAEFFWREHQTWLANQGYMLRPRYREDWEPSWLKPKKDAWNCEDGRHIAVPIAMDATRLSDGQIVSLKQIKKSEHPVEEQIIRFFSEDPMASDRRNHCVPLYDVLQSPKDADIMFLVMPHLVRLQKYKFATVGEAVECFRQLFEGLQFMHSRLVAHCDIQLVNIMMHPTPLLSDVPHPTIPNRSYDFKRKIKVSTRTEHPTRYYIIDFGLSRQFFPGDSFITPINIGGDRTVPEYEDPSGLSNPFPIDVYHLGNMIKTHVMKKSHSLNFMKPLLDDMTQTNPERRPTIALPPPVSTSCARRPRSGGSVPGSYTGTSFSPLGHTEHVAMLPVPLATPTPPLEA